MTIIIITYYNSNSNNQNNNDNNVSKKINAQIDKKILMTRIVAPILVVLIQELMDCLLK